MSVNTPVTESTATPVPISERIRRTVELHRELMALWEVEAIQGVYITLFPSARLYAAVDVLEGRYGTPTKRIVVPGGASPEIDDVVVLHAPREAIS